MRTPTLFSWIKQANQFVGARIKSGQIRALEFITSVARKRKVAELVTSAMLTRLMCSIWCLTNGASA
jgi:hypothetical protein